MKQRLVILSVLLVAVFGAAVWWHRTHHGASAESILTRADFAETSFHYCWTGGFSIGNNDVRASFSGNGQAALELGGRAPIRVQIPEERYRILLWALATNKFDQIKVKRRWGTYLNDIGKYKLVLSDRGRKTVVHVDEKHYVAQPECLIPILEHIYSFKAEFGKPLDAGPLGTAATVDPIEITIALVVAGGCGGIGILLLLIKRKRKRVSAEPGTSPNGGPAESLGNSEVGGGRPSVS